MSPPNAPESRIAPAVKITAAALIALVVVLAGLRWWQSSAEPEAKPLAMAQPSTAPPAAAEAVAPARETPPAIAEFAAFAEAAPPETLPLDHSHTARGVSQLARVVAQSGGDPVWRDRAERLEAAAARLGRDPGSLEHADIVREAFLEVADWLGDRPLREAAEGIRADRPLRAQKDQLQSCFRAAAAALRQPSA